MEDKAMKDKDWREPIHPGEILADELDYIGMTASMLADKIGVPKNRLYHIINGERGITADTSIRLGIFFNQSPDFWLNLQKAYEMDVACQTISDRVKNIVPYQPTFLPLSQEANP